MNDIVSLLKPLAEKRCDEVCDWFARAYEANPPSFYSSVDLRHSGAKLVPVDTNLFPAGFNHLSQAARARGVEQIRAYLKAGKHEIKRVLLIPENHTRNLFYLDNLTALKTLLEEAGPEVRIGSLIAEAGAPIEVENSKGEKLTEFPLVKHGNLLTLEDGYTPDFILMNNDLTSVSAEILRGVTQPIAPRLGLGWHRRRKSIHFDAYARVAKKFAGDFGFDPWLISAISHKCGRIDFGERKGTDCVALAVEKVLHTVRAKYADYGITEDPYVYVKSDSGTYGMGIMAVRSGDEITDMNKKNRNKMDVIKEGVQSTEVIIQEGVPTIDVIDGAPAEPMMYLINGRAVGGAFRVNPERDRFENLNARGMIFKGMCDEKESGGQSIAHCHFGVMGLVAQLATLAAASEEYGESYMI